MFVKPRHKQFQCAAGIEAGSARIGMHRRLGLFSGFENGGPFGLEEREIGQGITPFITLFQGLLPFLCPFCARTATDADNAISFLFNKNAAHHIPADARTGLFQLRHSKFLWKSLKGGQYHLCF